MRSDEEVLETEIIKQVPIENDVVNFKIISIEQVSPVVSRFQRSNGDSHYLVTFEITLKNAKNVDTNEQLSGILNNIEDIKPDSFEIIDQQAYNETGKFREYSD